MIRLVFDSTTPLADTDKLLAPESELDEGEAEVTA